MPTAVTSIANTETKERKLVLSKVRRQLSKESVTEKMILDLAKELDVEFVNMQFTDLFGMPKAVTIPVHKLEAALRDGVWFDGSSIEGFMRICESDMYLKPDVRTFAVMPWTIGTDKVTARIICDVYMPDGKPFEGDPRYILKRQLQRAKALGYSFKTGPELEFFLFRKVNGKLQPLLHDQAGYFDQTTDLAANIRADMSSALDTMNIEVEALHHEVAPAQHEIDFRYGDALQVADNAVTFKMVLKAIASRYGLHATFMPKPISGINGSGMHVHQSFFHIKNDEPAFYDAKDKNFLSDVAKHFIAGQLHYITEITAILNPLVNSYKRLVPGYEAPVYIAWGSTNRSALIRIPRFTKNKKKGARAELRCADPAANPYLAFAVMLAAGLDGVEKKMPLPEATDENIYHFDAAEFKRRNLKTLPDDLCGALEEMEKGTLARKTLGEHAFAKYCESKRKEWDEYRLQVTEWEIGKYLEAY